MLIGSHNDACQLKERLFLLQYIGKGEIDIQTNFIVLVAGCTVVVVIVVLIFLFLFLLLQH